MAPSPLRIRRSHLLASCMLAILAAPAAAQTYSDRALQGESTVVSGGVTIGRSPTADVIQVSTPQAIINWNPETGTAGAPPPAGSPWNFLPVGRTATFQGAATGQDFVVLNRVLPASGRQIQFNGTVVSQIRAGIGPTGVPIFVRGGSVWFYSPTGIIAGPTAIFNVGNLLLTTNDIDTTGGLFSGTGAIRFRGAANSTSPVTVLAGAQFNQPAANSYLALVAPQVTMGGTATINGSAAYVAAEQVDVTINNGLFDMSFITGTGVANALTHTGTTTGPGTANGTIAMATVAKNTAVTLLVRGTVGYTPAASATVQNGTVVLSAGYNLSGGIAIGTASNVANSNITIGNANFTTSVVGNATDTLLASPTAPGALTFSSNVSLGAENLVSIGADSGETLSVGGTLTLSSTRSNINVLNAAAGTARLYSTATTGSPLAAPVVTIGGNASVGADSFGRTGEDGQSAIGGNAQVLVTGGTLNLNGGLNLSSRANGGDGSSSAGSGTGGTANLTINGGTVTLGDALVVSADGFGGSSFGQAADGVGGTASVVLNAGATPSNLILNGIGHTISAIAGVAGQFPSANGGNATGGNALLTINSGTVSGIQLDLNAGAFGGQAQGGIAGASSGGTARVLLTGGRFDVGSLFVNADEQQAAANAGGTAGATAGTGVAAVDVAGGVLNVGANGGFSMGISANAIRARQGLGAPAASGNIVAGTARLTATGTGSITTDATAPSAPKPPVLVTASVVYNGTDPGIPGAVQRAGTAIVTSDGATMSLHRLTIRANALQRGSTLANDTSGPGFGGNVMLAARNGGTLTVRDNDATDISAYGAGGSTNTPALGTGGVIDIAAQGGTLTLPGLTVDARGFSGTTQGGTGGSITLRSLAGAGGQAGSMTAGAVSLDASGQINAGQPAGTNGNIVVSNTGPGQIMTFGNLLARAGTSGGAPSGSITLRADNAPIVTTLNFTGLDVGTLGTLNINAVGAAGTITGSTGVFGYGQDIFVSHTGVAPGSTSTLTGPSIQLQAGRDQTHTGSVTLRGGAILLVGRRTLGGADSSVISTGEIRLGSGLNATSNTILFRTLDSAGLIGGFQGASSTTPEIVTPGSFTIGERIYAGSGNIDIRAGTGVDIADAGTSATGQVLLSSTAGDVRLATSGVALATRPNGITLTAPGGTARFTNIFSRAGITATGQAVAGGSLNAATNVSLTGQTGVTVPTVIAGGTVSLNAPAGAVTVATNLQPGGTATATGQSIFLRSLGALNFSSLNATAGNLDVSTAGSLFVSTPQATDSVTLASTGAGVAFGNGTAGAAFTATAAGAVSGSSATSTAGPVTITGATGITLATIVSGGTTSLTAANGAVSVATNLQSAGLVTASGRSLFLRATGALPAANLTATAGNIDILSGGALSFTNAQATGNLILSAGTTILGGAASATGNATIGNQTSGGNVTLASLTTGGNASVAGSTATATLSVGTSTVGGYLEARGAALNFGTVTAGTDAILSSYNGALTVGDVTAGDDIFLTVNGSGANPNTVSPDSQTGVASATQFALNAGNLRSTGLGSDTAASGPRTFAGAGPTGNVIRVRASGAVQTGGITTAGSAIIASDRSTIATQAINANAGVAMFVTGNAAAGDITTNGPLWLGNSSQVFLTLPAYAAENYPFSQTATIGGATLGVVRAGAIRGTIGGSTTYTSITSTAGADWFSGGNMAGGNLSATGNLRVSAGGDLTFTTATGGPSVSVGAGGALTGISAQSVFSTLVSATGALVLTGDAIATGAGGFVGVGGNSTTIRDVISAGSATLNARTALIARSIRTQTDARLSSGGSIAFADLTAGANAILNATSTSGLGVGGALTGGPVTAGGALTADALSLTLGNIVTTGATTVNTTGGALTLGNVTAASLVAGAAGPLTTGAVTVGEDARLTVFNNLAMTTGAISAGDDIVLAAGGITTGDLTTRGTGPDTEADGSRIGLTAASILTGVGSSAGAMSLIATGSISYGALTAVGDIDLRASDRLAASGGSLTGGQLTTSGALLVNAFGEANIGDVSAGGSVGIFTGQAIRGRTVQGGGNVYVSGSGGVTLGNVTSVNGNVALITTEGFAGNNPDPTISIRVGDVRSGGTAVSVVSTDGNFFSSFGEIVAGTVNIAGDLQVQTNSAITLGDMTIGRSLLLGGRSSVVTGNVVAGVDAQLAVSANPAGATTLRVGNVTAGDEVWLSNFGTSINDTLVTGTLRSTGLGDDTYNGFAFAGFEALPTGNVVRVRSSGSVTTGPIVSPDRAIIVADRGAVTAAPIQATNGVALLAGTNATSAGITTSGPLVVANSAQFLNTVVPGNYQPSVLLNGAATPISGSFTATGPLSTGTLFVRAESATLGQATATTRADVATAGAIAVGALTGPTATFSGGTGVTIQSANISGTLNLAAAAGAVRINELLGGGALTASGQSVFARSTGAINAATLTSSAGDIDVASTGALAVTSANAAGALLLASGGTVTINGAARGRFETSISSADIAISAGATLGGTGSRITLTNTSTQNRTFIGDVTGTGGWRLDAAEIGRITGGNLTIVAPVIGGPASTAFNSNRAPDVTIGGFTASVGQQFGGEGTFGIQTAGKVRVVGIANFTNMGRDATVAIRGDEAIEILDAGRITLNGTGGLDGTLDLTSRNIVAASTAAYADFAAATTLGAISDRAGRNDGAVDDGGYLQARGINITLLNSTLIIQNSGAATTAGNRDYSGRRGFTVGAGGLTINQGGTNPMRIVLNGRAVGATTATGAPTVGGFVTGLDVGPLIRFSPFSAQGQKTFFTIGTNGATAAQVASVFDTASTSNGCAIISSAACRVTPDDPIRDVLDGDFGEDTIGNLLPLALIQLKDYVNPGEEPLIDEPVTGAGNDDLWVVDDDAAKCDPAKESCPKPN